MATTTDSSTGALAINTNDLIGARNWCETIRGFNGLVDEVTIYTRALSASEIQAIFDAGGAGKCKSLTGMAGNA